MGPIGPAGATGSAGPAGPAGPPGPPPVYFAGWVRGDATVRFGTGFTVARLALGTGGSYRITIPATATGRFLATVVTASGANMIARVAAFARNGLDGTSTVDVEIRDRVTGALVDGEFNFVSIDRS